MKNDAVRKQVMVAIGALGRRVTISDVASKTGLPLHQVTLQLNKLAAESGATMDVSQQGNIVYAFAPGFTNAFAVNGVKQVLLRVTRAGAHIAYFLLRVSFGVTLIFSLVTIALLFLFVMLQSVGKGSGGNSGVNSDGNNDSDSSFSLDWFDLSDFGSFFCWQIAARQYGNDYAAYTRGDYLAFGEKPAKQSFLLNCYSFLFGDGNPNETFVEDTWKNVANCIRQNGGTIISEQLSCYTGDDPRREYNALPTLVRFDGVPTVTDSGNVVYAFPQLQITAMAGLHEASPVPPYMQEKSWPFTTRSFDEMATIVAFGLMNLLGAVALLFVPQRLADLSAFKPLVWILIGYGVFFLLFPLLRFIVLRLVNIFIDVRNEIRSNYFSSYSQPTPELLRKKQEADQLAMAMQQVSAEQIVYTTSKDMLEQEFN